MPKNDELRKQPYVMSELSEQRLWKSLDKISDRLLSINKQMDKIVALEERVNHHNEIIQGQTERLNSHSDRIRESELKIAEQGDNRTLDRLIQHLKDEIADLGKEQDDIVDRINTVESSSDIDKGKNIVTSHIWKWLTGLLTAIILLYLAGKK